MSGGGTRKRNKAEETQMPENRLLEIVIDILQRRDTYEIFAQPVDAKEVEGYYEIVKEPMDFATMRAKLHDGLYSSLDQFKHDVDLITENAMEFNAPSTIFFKQARGIQELAKRIFHTLETDPESLETKFMGTRRRSTRIQLVNKSPTPSRKPPPPATPQIPTKIRRNDCKFTRGEELLDKDRRCTYTPSSVCRNERGCNQLIPSGELRDDGCSYRKSLLLFVRDLGPMAKMVAARKLGSSSTTGHQVHQNAPRAVNQNGLGGEVDSQKGVADNATPPHVIPVVLALEHSQPNITNPNEYYCKWKSRNKKPSSIPAADAEMTPLQKLEALMEEQGKKPSTFTFDLGFLKAQLHKMNTPAKC